MTVENGKEGTGPQERLEVLMQDMNSRAAQLAAEANDYEDRALALRAEVAALRTGAGGLEAAINRWHEEMSRAQARQHERDGIPEEDAPKPGVRPVLAGYQGDFR